MSQLSTIPQAMGRAVARMVGNLVYLHLTSNSKFTDGKALFHADHKNLIDKGMDTDGGNEARKAISMQQDANGDPINVIPACIHVPAALEGLANRAVFSSSSLFPVDQSGTLNQNPALLTL